VKITANMVTIARIALLPIPSGLLVWGEAGWVYFALVFGTLLGATDAVDGYMARRDGPTVLGGLLDPVADKLFLAAFLLPIAAKGHCPSWVVAAVFARELLITALRSLMAVREEKLVTSKLGKIKTIVQMGGLGIYVFLMWMPDPFPVIMNVLGVVGLLVTAVVFKLRGRTVPFWILPAVPLWAGVVAMAALLPPAESTFWLFIIIAAATWISGADYFWGAARVLARKGLRRGDPSKATWAIAAALALPLVGAFPQTLFPLMLGLGGHLALGGIDNIVTAERRENPKLGFALLSLTSLLTVAAGAAALRGDAPDASVFWATVLYAGSALFAMAIAFSRFRAILFEEEVAA
jgi:CDP-diacylglycerol--glycerol-3-phosphate 3-phosphatidyltransferase